MMKKIKNFVARHRAALLIGLLIASMIAITAGMIESIERRIGEINMIGSYGNSEYIPVLASGEGMEQYVIKEFDGRIGVYVPGDNTPARVIQVYVAYLPEIDRAKLEGGIVVNGRWELEKLLNEFTS